MPNKLFQLENHIIQPERPSVFCGVSLDFVMFCLERWAGTTGVVFGEHSKTCAASEALVRQKARFFRSLTQSTAGFRENPEHCDPGWDGRLHFLHHLLT